MKGLNKLANTVVAPFMIKRLLNDVLKPPSFSDDSETDYQLSGLTPVLPGELFR